ncbi:MAG: UDP-3-O-[Alphaproteobacteria bacterium]|nr:UDP-3-O-[3-hydroxymyristoyl] N-acetylglucosamine deacetylase [Alphaproteobacteria bacterium]
MQQHTLAQEIEIKGIGLHSGCESVLTLKPAPEDFGIVFKRVDLPEQVEIQALYHNVVDTRNCTCLGDDKGNIVSTIEHLMAALSMLGVDNVLIEINNQEMPIMDGSALPFITALEYAGIKEQKSPRKILKVLKKVEYTDDKGNRIELLPANDFGIEFMIEFPSQIVGRQKFNKPLTLSNFKTFVAPCRTFCEKYQVDYLKSIGLIKGGSLENAVVLDGETILNEGGFRVENECVNHKVIDAIGDMYTSGFHIAGHLNAAKTGHFHNNEILKILFADTANYEII